MNEEDIIDEEEVIKDIQKNNYTEQDVEKILEELENDTGNYSDYDLAIAIIFYKDLYNKEKEKNKELERKYENAKDMYIIKDNEMQNNYISKDKIKEKADDYESKGYIEISGAMKELLEERIKI